MVDSAADWEDPGWPPRVFLALLPFWARFVVRRRKHRANDLLALRTLYVSLVAAPLYLLLVLAFLDDFHPRQPTLRPHVAGLLAAAAGALLLLASVRIRGREVPLDESQVVGAFRAVFFVRFALANAAAIVGFVLFFLGGNYLWIYLLGLIFAITGLLLMAPTKRSIDEWDRPRQGSDGRPPLGALLTLEQ